MALRSAVSLRRRGLAAVVVALGTLVVGVPAASAAAPTDAGCRASGVRAKTALFNTEPITSNTPGTPCVTDADALGSLTLPSLLSSTAVQTSTDASTAATANAAVNNTVINISGVATIAATVASSTASTTCTAAGAVAYSGSSQVAGLTINGTPFTITNQPVTIPVGTLLVVAVNEQAVSPGKLAQRAIHISSLALGIDIVIAESVASGTTCPPVGTDLAITKTAAPSALSGRGLFYTLNVTNNGPVAANSVATTDVLPAGVVFGYGGVQAPAGWSCVAPGAGLAGAVSCSTPSMPVGATAQIRFETRVTAASGASITNTATVTSTTPETNPANNSASATTAVT